MKLSIALAAVIVAFVGSVSAAPTPDSALDKRASYPNCNSNAAYRNLNLPSGYAVLTGYDNNAADVGHSSKLASIFCTNTVYSPAGPNWGFCYPKDFR
ncbi:hypothetical protein QFC22_005996 [Naganishia vaughanmartiniae]|uniref:Uncharacterized protein n=1 Tax=Naganishia vaughanmartiniae TaxID=1424756 RepID=A0ACC2WT28_9TREE|nr:hypothetical protein QFC22_005996 [Naganishia vaughanmartiniae]